MMTKTIHCLVGLLLSGPTVSGFAFQQASSSIRGTASSSAPQGQESSSSGVTVGAAVLSRDAFWTAAAGVVAAPIMVLTAPQPASARGRATLEQAYERYAPRIKTGGVFYQTELKGMVASSDWKGIANALQEPPARTKSDLQKADAGVAERARQAGAFSDSRVLVAAELLAGAFSDNSISDKTRKMQTAIAKVRTVIKELQVISAQAMTGEEKSGGLFGLGAKKADPAALAKQAKMLYVEGGNAWNEYVAAANDSLALKFDRFNYIS